MDTGLAAELNTTLKTKRTQLALFQLLHGQMSKLRDKCSSESTEQDVRTDTE
ncbi:hypothetical protein [Levilactobacillus fujinensis]|uniref:Transposase n=1 Tax=Levilactobacillus fujinensis TaxID=2486024 RepID=A0ABW1TI10_9LACO|nr:hypothetical protein [Levilactobacillus fujinensis]